MSNRQQHPKTHHSVFLFSFLAKMAHAPRHITGKHGDPTVGYRRRTELPLGRMIPMFSMPQPHTSGKRKWSLFSWFRSLTARTKARVGDNYRGVRKTFQQRRALVAKAK